MFIIIVFLFSSFFLCFSHSSCSITHYITVIWYPQICVFHHWLSVDRISLVVVVIVVTLLLFSSVNVVLNQSKYLFAACSVNTNNKYLLWGLTCLSFFFSQSFTLDTVFNVKMAYFICLMVTILLSDLLNIV